MFSASNNNQDDDDDPYGFDVDFNSKKTKQKSSYYASNYGGDDDDIVFSDSEDEDPAEKFRKKSKKKKDKKKLGGGGEPPSGRRKSSTTGSALDRASAYLSKYNGGDEKKASKKKSPAKSPGDDFSAFMDDSDSDGGTPRGGKKTSPKPSHTRRQRRQSVEEMGLSCDGGKSESDSGNFGIKKGSASPTLGNTIKSKFSSPVVGVLKSGSDIKDIYRPPSPLYNPNLDGPTSNPATPMSAGNRSNISESMEESIASFTEDMPVRDEAMGKVMDFTQLMAVTSAPEEVGTPGAASGAGTPNSAKSGKKAVRFGSGEKSSPFKGGDTSASFGDGSYGEEDFEDEEEAEGVGAESFSSVGGGRWDRSPKVKDFLPPTPVEMEKPAAPVQVIATATSTTAPAKNEVVWATSRTSVPSGVAAATVSSGTQITGNDVGVQCNLAPAGMYGTSSSLDARFTLEGEGGAREVGDLILYGRGEVGEAGERRQKRGGQGAERGSLHAAGEAYLGILNDARREAEEARREVERLVGRTVGIGVRVGKTKVGDGYEEEAGRARRRVAEEEEEREGEDGSLELSNSEDDFAKSGVGMGGAGVGGGGLGFEFTAKSSLFGTKVSMPSTTFGRGDPPTGGGDVNMDGWNGGGGITDVAMIHNVFRRQLELVRRNVNSARVVGNNASGVGWGMGGLGVGATTGKENKVKKSKGKKEKKEKKEKGKKKKNVGVKGKRKKGVSIKKKSGGVISYWEALMKVDPSLTEKEAKRVARQQGERA